MANHVFFGRQCPSAGAPESASSPSGGPSRTACARGARLRKRRRILLAIGAVLTLATLLFPYDITVDRGLSKVHLTRLRTGVYETSAQDAPTRIFYMSDCTAPADDTRVTVRKGPTFGRVEFADVRFPTGELCSAVIVFGTRQEDQGVVRTVSSPRKKPPHAA